MMSRLPVWVAALWWASLSTIGFLVVPLLFAHLPTPALAGGMAAKLFSAQTWLSCSCGLFLLLRSNPSAKGVPVAQQVLIFIVAGMLLALLSEFAVAPRIVARENLRLWHSVGSAMFVLQWLCAALVFWKLTSTKPEN
ncbi:MAG: DUF4149 domain-containing protein [Rhodoferax sp.]|uniref:DUF4149 domain-containing protein n=1 Tax=Rhodoferax sp. TaxID=50421 RepID=UPI00262DC4C8|nr:DUF4149 domain-containing protein [Rhodoferax sp.]MDD5334184.1 DUF4149 domain-containing protein [Rhodoferax sp.]